MNKLDKQIKKLILKVCGNEYEYEHNLIEKENVDKTVSQIKQSILKAIIKKLDMLMDDKRIKQLEDNFEMCSRGWDKRHCPMCGASPSEQKEMIESVIKEILK